MRAPCAECAKPVKIGKGSRPAGQATCTECRRARRADTCPVWPRNCAVCCKPFIARRPGIVTCGAACSRRRRNGSDDYHRWKRSKRRSVTKDSDITPQQEGEMRKRARKCRICGCWMTGKPGKPNSKHLDHIIPIGVGGTHTHGNVRVICRACNLSRPKDGSDYSGPVTLWATAPGVAIAPKPQPAPPQPKPRKIIGHCACGAPVSKRTRQGSRCHPCLVELGREAARLRTSGVKWQEIAERLDYPNTGSLFGLVRLYGNKSDNDACNAIY